MILAVLQCAFMLYFAGFVLLGLRVLYLGVKFGNDTLSEVARVALQCALFWPYMIPCIWYDITHWSDDDDS